MQKKQSSGTRASKIEHHNTEKSQIYRYDYEEAGRGRGKKERLKRDRTRRKP